MTTLTPSFHLKFGHAILPGKVAVGRLDGKHPSLAAATTGGRILLHTPHELGGAGAEEAGSSSSSSKQPLRFLNINREVTALATGRLLPGSGRDALLVGTASSFQAYDVGENRDVFFREVPDAVTAAVVGAWGSGAAGGGAPLAFAGGNCSIQGYDGEGGDAYWTVAGDVVAAAAFGDVDGDGRPELLVGGDDFDIRLYKGEEAAREVTETDRVACLLVCPGARFAYALANATVGVYAGASFTRAWRVKGRARPTCLCLFDIDGDGAPELLAGYADGRFEARRVGSGEVVYRDGIGAAVAGLAATDYRGDGREMLLVVGADGEVRGYGQSDAATLASIRAAVAGAAAAASASTAAAVAASAGAAEGPAAAAAAAAAKKAADAPGAAAAAGPDIAALLCERAQLEGELRALEVLQAGGGGGSGAGSTRGSSLLGGGGAHPPAAAAAGALPASTDVSLSLTHNVAARRLELVATCSAGVGGEGSAPLLLRSLAVYALDAGVLGSGRESVVAVSPLTLAGGAAAGVGGAPLASPPPDAAAPSAGSSSSSSLSVPLAPASNVATELRVQAVVGAHHSSAHYAVICRPFALPKFAMFALLSGAPALAAAGPAPRGLVSLELPERAQRVSMWLQAAFGLRAEQVPVSMSSPALEVRLLHLRSGRPLSVSVAAEHGGAVALACDEMGLAGELVQDMAAYLALPELRSTADFPEELAAFRRTLEAMGELTAIRARMTGDSAAASGEVKALVIGAEDARLLGDMGGLRRCYGQLRALHGELVGEYAKRANNHAALVGVLKEVNQMIQKAANLRVGEARSRVIAACRAAIKSGAPAGMIAVIQQGRA